MLKNKVNLRDRQCGDFNIGGENAFLVKDDTDLVRFAEKHGDTSSARRAAAEDWEGCAALVEDSGRGRKPVVRGVAMNPIDHPHGGGEGRTSGGRHPVTPWGKSTKGKRTRTNKASDKYIVRRRTKKGKR